MKCLLLLATMVALWNSAAAQSRISYIIPDVGTTRFATLIEIIGPHDAIGNFGVDGVFANNAGDLVRVVPQRPGDTAIVRFGPCVVSWNGRMISTHAFVNPYVTPNSHDYRLLDPQYKIPVQVVVAGVPSATVDTFYVVNPWPVGNVAAQSDRVFGKGALGVRSPRGAMLVDSLFLGDTIPYTVDVADCDLQRAGNQGYLPFTLLATGNIDAEAGAMIRVDAKGSNAGPGGGGGGGGYANALQPGTGGPQGTAGGNGFTGGGPGGRNNNSSEAIWGPSSKRRAGDGTGQTFATVSNDIVTGGSAMNGVSGGESMLGVYENAGGGTGHPFGKSGLACDDFSGCSPRGQFGGGSGHRDRRRGGGGGFGEDGGFDPGAPGSQGRLHGNSMLVPLAGGSGGASGNPSVPGEESMPGGGGGGAISIHAQRLSAFTVYSNGSAGERNAGIGGGCGSGGGIVMGTRLDNAKSGFVSAQASGGDDGSLQSFGGYGRTRYDARTTVGSSSYVGPMTDTMTNSLRKRLMTGSGDGSDVQIWIKPENGSWYKGPVTSGRPTWSAVLDFSGNDTLYYVVAAQKVNNPVTSQHATQPQWVLSQSAWNIVRIYRPPVMQTTATLSMGQYRCPNAVQRETLWVYNRGESPLEVAEARFAGAPGFRMGVPAVFPDTVAPFDSSAYIVEFVPQPGQVGPQATTLTLLNNDPDALRAAARIAVSIDAQSIVLTTTFKGSRRDTIDLGTLCAGSPVVETLSIRNSGTVSGLLTAIRSANPNVLRGTLTAPVTLNANASADFSFVADARVLGDTLMPLLIDLDGCEFPDTLWLRFTGVAPQVTPIGSGQMGHVSVGATARTVIALRNDGSHPVRYSAPPTLQYQIAPTLDVPFSIVQTVPALPATIARGSSLEITVAFAPTVEGERSAWLTIASASGNALCVDTTVVAVGGAGSASSLSVTPPSIQFTATPRCATTRDSVVVRNTGSTALTLKYPAFVNGVNEQSFMLVREPLDDLRLGPGDAFTYVVEHVSTGVPYGPRTAVLSIQTDAADMPSMLVPLAARNQESFISGPTVIDLGNVAVGTRATAQATYANSSARPVSIRAIATSSPDVAVTPLQGIIPSGGSQAFDIAWTVRRRGPVADTIWFRYDTPCADSVVVIVRAHGVDASVVAPDVMRFQTAASCDVRIDSAMIVNQDTAELTILDVQLSGRDAEAFTLNNASELLGAVLASREIRAIVCTFDPRRMPDADLMATLLVTTRRGVDTVVTVTDLVGRRSTSIPAAPEAVVFGATDLLTPSVQRLTFVNRTSSVVTLTSIGTRRQSSEFALRDVPALPLDIYPNASFTLGVEFTAPAELPYNDSIVMRFADPCSAERVVPVSGRGRLDAEIYLLLPRVKVDPSADNYQLQIRGIAARGATLVNGGTLRLTMRHRASVFVPRSVSPGTIIRNEVIGGIAELEIDIPNVRIGRDTTLLTTVTGQATLGTIDSSDVRAVDARLTVADTNVAVRTYDGWILLDICREGGDRLLDRVGGLSIRALPNPATEHVAIVADVFEPGLHRIDIVDATGSVVETVSWTHVRGAVPFTMPVQVAELASGSYHIMLTTPTRRRVVPMHIVH